MYHHGYSCEFNEVYKLRLIKYADFFYFVFYLCISQFKNKIQFTILAAQSVDTVIWQIVNETIHCKKTQINIKMSTGVTIATSNL